MDGVVVVELQVGTVNDAGVLLLHRDIVKNVEGIDKSFELEDE
jgi:hypothetical protein